MRKETWKTRDMTFVALMAVLICVSTWICIPGAVPFTMQTFGVFAAVELLGGRRGVWAVAVYLLMGAVGLPVFSGMTGGFGILLGQTGGYLWGFLLIPLLCRLAEVLPCRGSAARVAAMVLGMILCYGLGTVWYVQVSGAGMAGWTAALSVCVLPFLIPDAVKLFLALSLGRKLAKYIR